MICRTSSGPSPSCPACGAITSWPSAPCADEEILVVAAEGNSTDAPELRKAIAARVSEACGIVPAQVAIVRVGSLPKTSSGKIQRRRTKQMHEEGLLEEHTS